MHTVYPKKTKQSFRMNALHISSCMHMHSSLQREYFRLPHSASELSVVCTHICLEIRKYHRHPVYFLLLSLKCLQDELRSNSSIENLLSTFYSYFKIDYFCLFVRNSLHRHIYLCSFLSRAYMRLSHSN